MADDTATAFGRLVGDGPSERFVSELRREVDAADRRGATTTWDRGAASGDAWNRGGATTGGWDSAEVVVLEPTMPVPRGGRRWWIGAAVAALLVAVVGLGLARSDDGGGSPATEPRVTDDDPPRTPAESAAVAFHDAMGSDFEVVRPMLAPNFSVFASGWGPGWRNGVEALEWHSAWLSAFGGSLDAQTCTAGDGGRDGDDVVTCRVEQLGGPAAVVGAPPAELETVLLFRDGKITRITVRHLEPIGDDLRIPFTVWLGRHDPNGPNLDGFDYGTTTIDEGRRAMARLATYAVEWREFLRVSDCPYDRTCLRVSDTFALGVADRFFAALQVGDADAATDAVAADVVTPAGWTSERFHDALADELATGPAVTDRRCSATEQFADVLVTCTYVRGGETMTAAFTVNRTGITSVAGLVGSLPS